MLYQLLQTSACSRKSDICRAGRRIPAPQNLLSIGLWSTLRGIFIALLVTVGIFDLVSVACSP